MLELTPAQRAEQAAQDYTNLLVSASAYSGESRAQQKVFSASMLGNDMLQNYLSWKYGKSDKNKYGANTTGSIYQLGCDSAVDKYSEAGSDQSMITYADGSIVSRYESALRIQRTLPNGWTISGEMDQIDHKLKVIIDNKVVSGTAFKEIMKNDIDHQYNLQLSTYQWLLEPTHGRYEAMLSIVNKAGAAIRNDQYATLHLNTHSSEDIEAAFIAETDALSFYIDNDMAPERCDIFKYGKTKDIPNRCAFYCDHNHHCPHYSDYKREKDLISALSPV